MKDSRALLWLRSPWHWLAVSIFVAHFVLATVYNIATPIWEGPDELGHYSHTRFLVDNLSLPGPADSSSALDELTHPPLYYVLTALATSWVDTSDNLQPLENPYAPTGITEGGVNRFIHSDAEAFPYRGTVLAVHVARLVSTITGTLVVVATYSLGRLLFPGRKEIALGATAITAFAPGFLFMSSVINNDMLVTLFFALALLFSVKILVREPNARDLLAIGVWTGLALLSKYNALALIPLVLMSAGIAMAKLWKSRASLARSMMGVSLLLIALAAVYGWWLWRSFALFGAATTRSNRLVARLLRDIGDPWAAVMKANWEVLPEGLRYFYTSFWASFGWGNISAETWVYQVLGLLCLVGVSGVALFMLGKAKPSVKFGVLLLLLSVVSLSALAIYRTLALGDAVLRGRYALPGIPAVSILLSLGIVHLTPRRLGRTPIFLAGFTMFVLGVIAPYRYIEPAYARPPIWTSGEAPNISDPLLLNFGGKVELLGYELGAREVTAGEFVALTLYWRCLAQMDENYTVGLAILGPDGEPYGQAAAYPGHGNYATSLWKQGEIVKDQYQIRVRRRFPAPNLARIHLALYTYPAQEHLSLLDSQGRPAERAAIFGRLAVVRAKPREYAIEHPLYYELGDKVALVGYGMEGGMFNVGCARVTLYWQALADMEEDYTVFVHLVDGRGRIQAQGDSQPRRDYWPTSYWDPGEVIEDPHFVCFPRNLSPGKYSLATGLYLLRTMERLRVFDQRGKSVADDQVVLSEEIELAIPDYRLYVPLVSR